ncbi:hypothetical protein AB0M43_35530 [Longispora sp. NPDC051575]|uniref:vWA domain-containing protein n=1 Tax=Longispora sp. NPDC051575 TaxID=3154943 RepID=UPI00342DE949
MIDEFPAAPTAAEIFPIYLVADTSGSTVRNDFHAGWLRALPELVYLVEEHGDAGRVCVLTFATDAVVRVPLTAPARLTMLPATVPGGVTSLAAGLRRLADTVAADRAQFEADGITVRAPRVLVLMDGLPTDATPELLLARAALDAVLGTAPPHLAVPAGADDLALAGLRMTVHRIADADPAEVAAGMVGAARSALSDPSGCAVSR